MTTTRTALAGTALLGLALTAPLLATPASAADGAAEVRLLHGIPGTPVDVYVNGSRALDDFQPGTTTDDLKLAAGTYKVAVFPANAADGSGTPVIGPLDLTVPATGNVSVVAHLTADGTPTVTPYVNDTSAAAAGSGRLVVRHDAAAPTVDVLAGGQAVITGLSNPGEKTLDLPAATVSASVAATGTTTPVLGPTDVPIVAGQATIVYAIGSLADKTLGVLVQTVPLHGGSPSGVPAGTGGLVADGSGLPLPVALASGLGVLVAVGAGAGLVRARSRS